MRLWKIIFVFLIYSIKHPLFAEAMTFENKLDYSEFKNVMWTIVAQEPCLEEIIRQRDVARAELIYLLHTIHLYQYPLSDFCSKENPSRPKKMRGIQAMQDRYTHRPFSPSKKISNIGSIGIDLFVDRNIKKPVVTIVAKNGIAHHVGFQRYDIIEEINGRSTLGKSTLDIYAMILGDPGSKISMIVRRGNETKRFSLYREEGGISDVSWTILREIGYLQVLTFDFTETYEYFTRPLEYFRDHDVKAIILDMRGNRGGSTRSAACFLSLFFNGAISVPWLESHPYLDSFFAPYYFINRDREKYWLNNHVSLLSWLKDIPMVIFVDRYSFSSTEMVAGAFSYYKRGLIVGENTGGKGTIQLTSILHDHSSLYLTTGQWFLPDGSSVNEIGLKPAIMLQEGAEAVTNRAENSNIELFYKRDKDLMKTLFLTENYIQSKYSR